MDRRQITTIFYLIVSVLFFLTAIVDGNQILVPFGIFFLALGGFNSQKRNEKTF